jgi:MarR family transcriptional regulator, organic hydroperoxide resistance regulator
MKKKSDYSHLHLDRQICFPLYAASRLLIKLYQPALTRLALTYPQYLVLLSLWEKDNKTVSDLSEQLLLESNTLTPLLKRLSAKKLINRKRSLSDERSTVISLTTAGKRLKVRASGVPGEVVNCLQSEDLNEKELLVLQKTLRNLLQKLR